MTILTPPQIAARWHCSDDAVRHLLATGKLRGFRAGRSHWRVRLDEVERYERGESPEPQPAQQPVRRSRRRRQTRQIPDGPF